MAVKGKISEATKDRVQQILFGELALGSDYDSAGKVPLEAELIDNLGADSLAIVEIVVEVDKDFGTNIPDEVSEKFVTGWDIVNHLVEIGKG